MTTLWHQDDVAAATGGVVYGPQWEVSGISIDTRTIQPGDLFVALTAARDGHEFVQQAFDRGAAAAMISTIPDNLMPNAPFILVPDVQQGLELLGRAGRARQTGRVAAVTGSVGKTTTKDMLHHMLARQGRSSAAQDSYNNHWGVPLTLARIPIGTEYAVIEIGMNHPGEIAPLTQMARPDVAAITAIAPAHIEAFGHLDGIAEEKASIFSGLNGGTAIYPDTQDYRAIFERHAAYNTHWRFGPEPESLFALKDVILTDESTVVKAMTPQGALMFKLGTVGRHLASNALCALAMLHAMGADIAMGAMDLADWAPREGRGTREEIVLDAEHEASFALIDDAFNANPASMAAAFEVLAAAKPGRGGRRVAILGDMLELGETEQADHAALAEMLAKHDIDIVHCAGPRMRFLHEELAASRRGQWADDALKLKKKINRLVAPGDVVLVKGSKGSQISLLAAALRARHHTPRSEEI